MRPSCSEAISPAHQGAETLEMGSQHPQGGEKQGKTPNRRELGEFRLCEWCVGYWGFLVAQARRKQGIEQSGQPGEPGYYF